MAFDLFSSIPQSVIGNWAYTRSPYRYQISLNNDQYEALQGLRLLNGGVIVLVEQGPRYWDKFLVVALAIIVRFFILGVFIDGAFVTSRRSGRTHSK